LHPLPRLFHKETRANKIEAIGIKNIRLSSVSNDINHRSIGHHRAANMAQQQLKLHEVTFANLYQFVIADIFSQYCFLINVYTEQGSHQEISITEN